MMQIQHSKEAMYVAMELSANKWKLQSGDGKTTRGKTIRAGDQTAMLEELAKAKKRFGLPEEAPVHCCYEAGRDGFWIYRFLRKNGVQCLVVDPASIEVNRRQRRAKTDRLDAEKLLSMLFRYLVLGETMLWKICHVPSQEVEDERRPGREEDRLKKERTAHVNRIRSLLVTQGVRSLDPFEADFTRLTDWEGKALPPALVSELQREQQRLRQLQEQLAVLHCKRAERLAEPQSETDGKARKLQQLRGIGPVGSWMLAKEFFWRKFQNRRQVGAAAGLTGTPYDSGNSVRDQGISKAGSKWIRKICTELAWMWVRFQPQSQLTLWFRERFGGGGKRMRRIGIIALARKLLIALWRFVEMDEVPEGAVFNCRIASK